MSIKNVDQETATIGNRTWKILTIEPRRTNPQVDYTNVVLVNDKNRTGGVTAHFQDDGTLKCAGWDGLNSMTTEQLEPIAKLIANHIASQQFNIDTPQKDTAQ